MTRVAIITAMQSEFDAVRSLYNFKNEKSVAKAQAHGKEIILIKSGLGKVNAALATNEACKLGANIVINTGLAGGIDNSLEQGDVVLADKVCYHDVWCGEPNAKGQVQDFPLYFISPSEIIQKISQSAPHFKLGLTVTGDQFLTDVTRLKEIKQLFPQALAVDMESAAVAQTCYLNKIPFISLRIISDVVGKEKQLEQYNSFWEKMPHQASKMLDTVIKTL